jgi:hypothetical protein
VQSARRRAAQHCIHQQNNVGAVKELEQAETSFRQVSKLAPVAVAGPEAVNEFKPHIVVARQRVATADDQ